MNNYQLGLVLLVGLVSGVLSTPLQPYIVTDPDSTPLLGTKKCTYGPSYWCHNITQAASCKAVPHCIKTWEKTTLPPDNDDVCQVCKEMVKEARDQLLSNQTQDELRQVLEGSCQLIPLKIVSNECIHLADNFIPELVDALASRMDPQVVCAVSGLCNSERIDRMLEEQQPLTRTQPDCNECNYYVSKLFKMDESDLKLSLLDQCGYLGSYSDSCTVIVQEESSNIHKHLQKSNPHDFCNLVGICGLEKIVVKAPREDLSCDFCKQLVNYLRKWLTDNTTKEEFGKVVENLCKETGKYKEECRDFFRQYGEEIYQLLLEDLDAEGFCERVGVCNGTMKSRPVWTILSPGPMVPLQKGEQLTSDESQMVALVPGEKLTGDDESNALKQMLPLVPGEMMTGDDERNALKSNAKCELCELVVTQLQTYLDSPDVEKSVENFVDNLCDRYLPKEMSQQCNEFVTNYGDQLVELVVAEVDPKEICPRLHLCDKLVKDIMPTCSICEFTVTKLINMIGKNVTKESIEHAAEKVCSLLPSKYKSECDNFMTNYGDQVIEMILIEGSSHEICAALHLCLFSGGSPVIDTPVAPVPVTVQNDDPKCVLCEYVITTLDSKMKDNATEEEIKAEVEAVCDYLPRTVKANCRKFVDEYGDLVIAYLAQQMDPSEICTELKLCKKTLPDSYTLNLDQCQLCNVLADYLSKKSEEKEVVVVAKDKFCPLLRNLKRECVEMVEDYGGYLVELLSVSGGKGDKGEVCRGVDLC